MERNTPTRVESAHRALILLKMLMEEGEVGVTDAAGVLDVNASTAHRLLATLVADGFAERRADRRYVLGEQLRFADAGAAMTPLSARLRPALERLFDRIGETVHIAALVGTRIQHLDGIEASTHPLRFGLRVGVWLPAHVASGGKVLLADLNDADVESRYQAAYTGSSVEHANVDMPALLQSLDDIRQTRVAWNFEESEPGVAAVAISVGDGHGRRAALSVAAPIARYTPELGEVWAQALIDTADEIGAESSAPPHPSRAS